MSEAENVGSMIERCAICGEHATSYSVETQQFAYRHGDKEVLLTAEIPVVSCAACAEIYTGLDAEEAQHAAVCHYLGRLTPAEIRGLRTRHGLSQAKLAELTGIGIASIKRWEAGTVVQNASLDSRLRQLDTRTLARAPVKIQGRFKTQLSPEMYEAAKNFCLRPVLQAAALCL